jgi:ferredoxin-NADP reductase
MNLTLKIDGKTIKRSYTIASSPTQRGHVELTIKRNPNGAASRFMHDVIKVGDSIRVGAPAGKFFFNDLQADAVVLIAGGVGITPLMAILRNLTDRAWRGTIYFVNAVRSNEDKIYANELVQLANRFGNLHVLTCYSKTVPEQRSECSSTHWREQSGHITGRVLKEFVPKLETLPVFLCGPDGMMQAVREAIVSLGIPNSHVATEEFVSPKSSGAVKAIASMAGDTKDLPSDGPTRTVVFNNSNRTVDVESSTTILEASEEAGVMLPWECRSGICGQCKVRCHSGRVKMISRDAITNMEIADGYILACQSVALDETVAIDA